jgi:hypothetical protein
LFGALIYRWQYGVVKFEVAILYLILGRLNGQWSYRLQSRIIFVEFPLPFEGLYSRIGIPREG